MKEEAYKMLVDFLTGYFDQGVSRSKIIDYIKECGEKNTLSDYKEYINKKIM